MILEWETLKGGGAEFVRTVFPLFALSVERNNRCGGHGEKKINETRREAKLEMKVSQVIGNATCGMDGWGQKPRLGSGMQGPNPGTRGWMIRRM